MTSSDDQAAQELKAFFKSVFVIEDSKEMPEFTDRTKNGSTLSEFSVTPEEVCRKLEGLKSDKSPGPDSLHPAMLKKLAGVLCTPLATLFNLSLKSGQLPDDWKCANVTAIHKKGNRSDVGNYRPVSLTSVPCKIMESLIRSQMLDFLDSQAQLAHEQHGFTHGRSCLTNLLESLEEWTRSLDDGFGLDIVFLDYQKAFDTVPHKRLIKKLRSYGINGNLLKWIEEFLIGRKMRVVLNESVTDWEKVLSGVPQGSVLGPLLFLLYVNDIPEVVKCSVRMFADDTKIWQVIRDEKDCLKLQEDLQSLEAWSEKWLLRFNAAKCKIMHMGRDSGAKYHLYDSNELKELKITEVERDLGILVSKHLRWGEQCGKAAGKAMSVLGMIRRTFEMLDEKGFILLYNTYVRPHLEYCVQAWSPYLKKDIECLEKIQRRATKMIFGYSKLTYNERLKRLKLFTLEQRRERGNLIEVFKILTRERG